MPEVRPATALAAWPGTWVRDEEARARYVRSKGQTQTLPVTHGADVIVMTCISAALAGHSRSLPSWDCLAVQVRIGWQYSAEEQ